MADVTVRVERACSLEAHREDHLSHDWDTKQGRPGAGAAWWCPGWPRQPRAVSDPAPPCGTSYTGPTGIVWDCTASAHYTDPRLGIHGSGHHFRARYPALDG